MGSAMAGPLNGSDVPGVAWQADVHSAIGGNDVLGVGYQFDAIRAADAANAKIITMAWGSDNFSIPIADELLRLWRQRDVLLVAAAGTSPAWLPNNYVVFPASLSFVLAVSAANLDGNRKRIVLAPKRGAPTSPYQRVRRQAELCQEGTLSLCPARVRLPARRL